MSTPAGTTDRLRRRWQARFPRLDRVGADLLDRYAEPWRVYHDRRHLTAVLDRCDELADAAAHPGTVELAAWFHDAVYEIGRDDNERRSAALARRSLHGFVEPEAVDEIARLVLLTRHHEPAADDPDGAVLCDADLAVLAGDPSAYDEYARRVREEYRAVPDPEFRRGRAAVLQRLSDREHVFGTSAARARWEEAARANLARELTRLVRS